MCVRGCWSLWPGRARARYLIVRDCWARAEAGAARNRPQIKQWEWVRHGAIVHQCTLCRGQSPGHIMPANISRGYNWSNQIIGEHSRNALSLCSAAIMAIIKMLLWKRFLWINVTLYVNIPNVFNAPHFYFTTEYILCENLLYIPQ